MGESRRDRYRAETRQEAKRIALEQLAAAGPSGISVNAIAKQMGVTGPALYRYFASRDDLLTELIGDAYGDLADTVERAATQAPRRGPAGRLRVMSAAFREWAVDAPHRYLLLFGTPVPGYRAPAETVAAAHRTMVAFAEVLDELPAAPGDPGAAAVDKQCAALVAERGMTVSAAGLRRAVLGWTRMHGVLSLEVEGQFDGDGPGPRPALQGRDRDPDRGPLTQRHQPRATPTDQRKHHQRSPRPIPGGRPQPSVSPMGAGRRGSRDLWITGPLWTAV